MSYMGLFWETGMPEAWALSRKSEERPVTESWPQNSVDLRPLWDADNAAPGDSAGQSMPKPDGGKSKKG